jgi:phosphatidylserine/phosphatidylglycerophosphate/cardiolipin synthase-like enzyme
MERTIHRSAASPNRDIADCLQALLVSELLSPGTRLLVISPWMSDFPALDNSGARFAGLDPSWTASKVRFSAVLRSLLRSGVNVRLACGPGVRESDLVQRLVQNTSLDGTTDLLAIRRLPHEHRFFSHEKALLADRWAMFGSMNLTYRGVALNGELITVTTDPARVAAVAADLSELFT